MYLECFFSNYEREAEMTQVQKQSVLPGLGAMSDGFKDGYDTASSGEHTGWPIEYAPNERTIVEFVVLFKDVVNYEVAHGRDCDYSIRWMAGLLAGWLRRE